MWIGFEPPAPIAWSITGGTFTGDSDGSLLTNGHPRSLTRFQWPAGAQTTATTVVLTGTFPTMAMPDIAALLNVSLPAGTKVSIKCREDGSGSYTAMGGNSTGSRTILRADQTVGLVWYFDRVYQAPGPISEDYDFNITGIEITIYNDVDGVASIVAESLIDLGEFFITPADYFELQRTLSSAPTNPDRRRAIDNTILSRQRYTAPAREETYDLRTFDWSDVGNGASKMRATFERAAAADRVLFIPRWHLDGVNARRVPVTTHADSQTINDSAVFGVITNRGPFKLTDDKAWDTSLTISEAV